MSDFDQTKAQGLHRILLPCWAPGVTRVDLGTADSHHVREVLRLRHGDMLRGLVPDGHDVLLRIVASEAGRVACVVSGHLELPPEPRLRVSVYQGLTRPERFEYTLQKCTEIGAAEFVPVVTRRSIVKPSGRGPTGRLARWRRIVEEAALQSGRAAVPTVHEPLTWRELLAATENESSGRDAGDLSFVASEHETTPLGRVLAASPPGAVETARVLIGPEAGLDPAEVTALCERGFVPVSLGPRILRTETAGPVLLTILLYELADLGGAGCA